MENGVDIIKSYLKNLGTKPGVYRMICENEKVLYVGKAKNLSNRVKNYTNLRGLSVRIAKMVMLTRSMEFITTHTEVEALLLEANLIKRYKPHYNILLKDDKSFPYILIDKTHKTPRVLKHRGAKKKDGYYFGPFASASAVNISLNTLQKAFSLRTCSDSVFESRSRPCLLYQIKRCSAPCVGKISDTDYNFLVEEAHDFLSGKSETIKVGFTKKMEEASDKKIYELAAVYRDRLKALATVQSRQDHTNEKLISADLIAAFKKGGQTCVQVFFYRSGQNWGNKAYFPRHDKDQHVDEVLSAFISQFYDNKPLPKNIFINSSIKQKKLLEEALTLKAESKVTVTMPQRGASLSLIQTVEKNARDALDRKIAETSSQVKLLEGIALLFGLDATPSRIEVYDNSHISGTSALGAMIVSGIDGFEKASYRKFNIKSKDLSPGDDFGMMREVLTRRFKRQLREDPDRDGPNWPDLLLIDGGKGQLSAVLGALEDLGLNEIPVVCIAKGKDRNAGREDFYMVDKKPFKLPPNDPVLYFLQRLRDESHRFVIGSHRSRRAKNVHKSLLDDLPSVGLVRKKHLLLYFGSAKAVSDAGITDLNKVKGISNSLATQIYDYFHP